MEYYSALKREEIRTHAIMSMNHEDIMLSETGQSQNNRYCQIPLLWGALTSQIRRDGKKIGGSQGQQ